MAISLGIPVGTLIYWFTQSSQAALSSAAANVQYLWPATATSVLLGIGSAAVAVVFAWPVATLVVRYGGRVATTVERSVYLAFALPDLVAAIALAYAASHYVHVLYGTVVLLVLAEAMLFVPFAVVALRSTFGLIEPAMEESGRSLGLGPLRTLWRVTVPLARPGIAAAGMLVFGAAGRPVDGSGPPPPLDVHPRNSVRPTAAPSPSPPPRPMPRCSSCSRSWRPTS